MNGNGSSNFGGAAVRASSGISLSPSSRPVGFTRLQRRPLGKRGLTLEPVSSPGAGHPPREQDADPAGAPLLLPHRLAAALRRDPLPSGAGRCEECARPHLQRVFHLGDGRWWDAEISGWRDGRGRRLRQRLRDEDLLAGSGSRRWCWRQPTVTTTPPTTTTPTSRRSASAATCCTTATSISAAAGAPCSGARPWATCSRGRIRQRSGQIDLWAISPRRSSLRASAPRGSASPSRRHVQYLVFQRAPSTTDNSGKLPTAAKIGRIWTYNEKALRDWLRDQEEEQAHRVAKIPNRMRLRNQQKYFWPATSARRQK